MSTPTSLFLAPADPLAAPAPTPLVDLLRDLEIIAEPLGDKVFAANDGFSRHVVYAGCSPHLQMSPPEDGSPNFCHVAVHGPFTRPHLVTGPNTVKPRCPHCRTRFDDWREHLSAWRQADALARCADCGRQSAPYDLDWRGHALGGRVLIELRNVYPGEASPSDRLLDTLREADAGTWRYAWAACLGC